MSLYYVIPYNVPRTYMNMYPIFNTSWPVAFRLCVSLRIKPGIIFLSVYRNYRAHNKKDVYSNKYDGNHIWLCRLSRELQ